MMGKCRLIAHSPCRLLLLLFPPLQAKDYTIGVLLDKLEVLKASYVHAIGAGKTIFGEVVHPLSNKDAATGVTIGGQVGK